jgi:hypothetical protein
MDGPYLNTYAIQSTSVGCFQTSENVHMQFRCSVSLATPGLKDQRDLKINHIAIPRDLERPGFIQLSPNSVKLLKIKL